MSVDSRRNGIWFLLFAAAPAARGLRPGGTGGVIVSRRTLIACGAVLAAMAAFGLARTHPSAGASPELVRRAVAAAHGTPILAEPIAAEQLALDGQRIVIGNPLEAFNETDQRLYLDWLRGEPAGDAILAPSVRAVLVRPGTPPDRRLHHLRRFRELGRDAHAVLYTGRG
jgi:hypothetical protein